MGSTDATTPDKTAYGLVEGVPGSNEVPFKPSYNTYPQNSPETNVLQQDLELHEAAEISKRELEPTPTAKPIDAGNGSKSNSPSNSILAKLKLFSHKINPKIMVILAISIFGVSLIALSVVAFGPQKANFSYATTNCLNSVYLLPNSQKLVGADNYNVNFEKSIKVANKPIISRQICLQPKSAPKQDSNTKLGLSLLGQKMLTKNIAITSSKYPTLDKDLASLAAVSVTEPLSLKLASPDMVFDFALSANDKTVQCQKDQNIELKCDPSGLGLKHATEYSFSIVRTFSNKPVQTINTHKIVTITPIIINNSSIADGSVRYDKPKTILITTDKQVSAVRSAQLVSQKDSKKIATTVKFTENNISLEIGEELARGQSYKLTIDNIFSTDGGSLIKPYELAFSTSNGPKVTGVSIGNNTESIDKNIVIKFDQDLDKAQDISKHVKIISGDKTINATASVSGASVILRAQESLPACSPFSIATDAGIVSPNGISGASAWSFGSRTDCFTSFSIGDSVEGRPIIAHSFGSGKAILFVAGVHGNEQNATKLMYKWINEINQNPQKVPANRSVVIIPSVNPDGYAKKQRVNAHGIDLNRNFAANNWKSTIKEPSGEVLAQGGGASPQSEPETVALSAYVSSLRPAMVMSYHSYGGLAIANDAGASRSLASSYGAKSGYVYKNGDTIGNTFNYDTTGAFEDWLYDKLATPAILIELRSQYDDEFSRNVGPMWAITQAASY